MDHSPITKIGESIIEVTWYTKPAGNILFIFAAVAVVVLFGIQYLNGKISDVTNIIENLLIISVILYGAFVCSVDKTIIEKQTDDTIKISYGPLPIMPDGTLKRDQIKKVEVTWNLTRGNKFLVWRVVITSDKLQQYPITFGFDLPQEKAKEIADECNKMLGLIK